MPKSLRRRAHNLPALSGASGSRGLGWTPAPPSSQAPEPSACPPRVDRVELSPLRGQGGAEPPVCPPRVDRVEPPSEDTLNAIIEHFSVTRSLFPKTACSSDICKNIEISIKLLTLFDTKKLSI